MIPAFPIQLGQGQGVSELGVQCWVSPQLDVGAIEAEPRSCSWVLLLAELWLSRNLCLSP